MTPNPTGPAASTPPRQFGDALTWIGGADRTILRMAPTNRGSFVQMGLVVLATAGLGVLSMSFALHNGLHLPVPLAVFGGLVWGCVIAVVDRFLVMNLNLHGGAWKTVIVVGVRILIAGLLGLVISTPLVLRVFQDEIRAQVVANNIDADAARGDDLQETAVAKELGRVREEISTNEATLRGEQPAGGSAEVTEREAYLDKARQVNAKARDHAEQKYRAWQCELYGSSCEGSTNVSGNGNLARAREAEYLTAQRDADAAARAVSRAESALASARESASAQGQAALRGAQDEARAKLPDLRERESQLQARFSGSVDTANDANSTNDGLLAQIVALGDLGERDGAAAGTHYAVAGLLFMIELLPVLVKILTSLGPPSAYERARELAENTDVDNAKVDKRRQTRQRDEEERRATEEIRKEGDVFDDMRARERDLGIKANERVANEMEKVLDVALAQWARDVRKTLHNLTGVVTNGVPGGGVAPGGQPVGGQVNAGPAVPHGAQQPAAAGQSVRSKFNLPNGKNLGSTNGSTP